jgi:hypothetical protein
MTARFCVTLSEQEFSRMVGYIKQRQATTPIWNAMTLNCTGFTGDVARFIGLKAPLNHVQMPEEYINEMHRLNSTPAQYSAYQAEMRRVNSIPVPPLPAQQRVTIAGPACRPLHRRWQLLPCRPRLPGENAGDGLNYSPQSASIMAGITPGHVRF